MRPCSLRIRAARPGNRLPADCWPSTSSDHRESSGHCTLLARIIHDGSWRPPLAFPQSKGYPAVAREGDPLRFSLQWVREEPRGLAPASAWRRRVPVPVPEGGQAHHPLHRGKQRVPGRALVPRSTVTD